MNIMIKELKENDLEKYDIENFLLKMIKICYNLDYVPEYHQDIKNMDKYYIEPQKNTFFIAIDSDKDKIVGSCGIRGYDKNYNIKDKNYNKNDTASIWRLFVEPDYRHNKIATRMLEKIEDFCKKSDYRDIYLHTQRDSYGGLEFWLNYKYTIVEETYDEYGTIHLEKIL